MSVHNTAADSAPFQAARCHSYDLLAAEIGLMAGSAVCAPCRPAACRVLLVVSEGPVPEFHRPWLADEAPPHALGWCLRLATSGAARARCTSNLMLACCCGERVWPAGVPCCGMSRLPAPCVMAAVGVGMAALSETGLAADRHGPRLHLLLFGRPVASCSVSAAGALSARASGARLLTPASAIRHSWLFSVLRGWECSITA